MCRATASSSCATGVDRETGCAGASARPPRSPALIRPPPSSHVDTDARDLFRIDAAILAIDGVKRTETALSMGELVPFRVAPLLKP